MDKARKDAYFDLFEKLISSMTESYTYDKEKIDSIISEMCKLFRLSKASTEFYKNLEMEKIHTGEEIVGYDDGTDSKPVVSVRIVTAIRAVVKGTAFMNDQAEPLDEDERNKVELIMRAIVSFVSRRRLHGVVEYLTTHDVNNYHNSAYYHRAIDIANEQGTLAGKAAIHYNLRHFSLINREIGRKAGDFVMRSHFEGVEKLVGENGIVCRLGGDNFLALCDMENLEDVLDFLYETPIVYNQELGNRVMIHSSVGVFRIPDDFVLSNKDIIMDKLMTASQVARTGGKDRIVFYSDDIISGKEKMMMLQQCFLEALRNQEFKAFYQPKVDIVTGELSGAEALCRWFRDGSIVPPIEFIPLLEKTSDICKLDFYMLDRVCRDIRRWMDEGKKIVRISVNFSRKHMMDVDLLKNILETIDKYNVPHEYIEIELTETTTDVEFRDLKRVVGGLQKSGICTSVDDFGMGYSSLNLIGEIPWDVLKVDRSFLPVEEDNSGSNRSIMFKYVVAMAIEMGLECIAEGVETQAQVDILRENKCGYAQGFFFDKPLPVDQFEKKLEGFRYNVK